MCERDSGLDELLARVRGEYLEMPGLRLTVSQASRLWGLDAAVCEALLSCLEASGFLRQTRAGAFGLASTDGVPRRLARQPAIQGDSYHREAATPESERLS